MHSASCVHKSVGSLCEGFVSVHSASCVLGSLCERFPQCQLCAWSFL